MQKPFSHSVCKVWWRLKHYGYRLCGAEVSTSGMRPVTENHEKLNFCHFEAVKPLKPPFQSCGALRSRAMFKYNLQREASALEVILHQGQTAHDGPDNLQEK